MAPHLFNRTLPCNFPSIVIWERLHSLTFIMSPVASIGCLSHLLIALKLQFTWIAGGWPQKILSPLAASSLGQIAIAECPMETNRTLNPTSHIWPLLLFIAHTAGGEFLQGSARPLSVADAPLDSHHPTGVPLSCFPLGSSYLPVLASTGALQLRS